MSWSRPTPRSGEAIPMELRAPHGDNDVIPIRGITPATAPRIERVSGGVEAARAKAVPVEARPWRILFVPPTPGAQTRAFNLSAWQRKAIVVSGIGLIFIAVAAVTTVIVGVSSPDLFTPSAELAAVRGRLQDVEDSLAATRVALADAEIMARALRAAPEAPSPARRRMLLGSSSVGAATSTGDGFPVVGTISSEFSSARRHPLLRIVRPHLGLDISAARGTSVSSPAPGTVTFSGYKLALGTTIEIEHADGVITRYGHLRLAVAKQGDHVSKGTLLGTVGSSGLTTGPHLHYEILRFGRQVDPMRFHFPQAPLIGAAAPPMVQPAGLR
ncbi:MAG: M23 family metallopeptidase [Gemmatimonadaceae bacterium]